MLTGRPRTATRVARFSSQAGPIPREIAGSKTQIPRTRETPSSNHFSKGEAGSFPYSLDSAWFGTDAAANSSQREAASAG
jgi:hypothetical protein